jgi:hypothetical protein
MRLLIGVPALAAALLAVGPSVARDRPAEQTVEQALAGFRAGEPTNCLPNNRSFSSRRVGESTVLFRVRAGELWRNDLPRECAGIDSVAALVTQTPVGRLCRGDIVNFVDLRTGIQLGSCPLGQFVPYRREKK